MSAPIANLGQPSAPPSLAPQFGNANKLAPQFGNELPTLNLGPEADALELGAPAEA